MENQDAERAEYLTFGLAGRMFAANIQRVREIIPAGAMTKVPMTPRFVRGILNLRGAVVPVIDLQSRLGWAPAVVTPYTCIVIIESPSTAGPTLLGLMVDAVSEVIEIPATEIEPPPPFGTPIRHELIEGMARREDGFLVILKPTQAFDLDALTQLAATAQSANGK